MIYTLVNRMTEKHDIETLIEGLLKGDQKADVKAETICEQKDLPTMKIMFGRLNLPTFHGHPQAQYYLARLYYHGFDGKPDYQQAFKYCQLSANQGNPKAQYGLGYLYAQGEGVEQDDKEAFKYFQLSADHGNPEAQN